MIETAASVGIAGEAGRLQKHSDAPGKLRRTGSTVAQLIQRPREAVEVVDRLVRLTALTIGCAVSQCADATIMTLGLPIWPPICLRNSRAGVSVSGKVGAPWDRKRPGRVMVVSNTKLKVF